MDAARLMQFEEGLLKYMTDPDSCSATESTDARQLCDMCDKWLADKQVPGAPSPNEIWQACVNVLEQPSPLEKLAPAAEEAAPGSRIVSVVTRTRSVVEQDTARAADFVLVLARLFTSSNAHEEAAKACLYAIETCPGLMAELTDVAIPDHAPPDGPAERWRETDFAKTVDMLLDVAIRARLPLGRELGEALVRHRTVLQFASSVVGSARTRRGEGRVHHNVRGVPCLALLCFALLCRALPCLALPCVPGCPGASAFRSASSPNML